MAYVFELPDIGEGLTEAEIVEWLIAVGDKVAMDEPLVVIETDKTTMEIPSPVAGILVRQGCKAGEILLMGKMLAELDTGDDTGEVAPIVGTLSSEAEVLPAAVSHTQPASVQKPRAYPPVRKLATQNGVDLKTLSGSGPNGRIIRSDVLAAIESAVAPSPEPLAGKVEAMSSTRRAIARNLTEAWQQIPQVTTFEWADGEALLDAKRSLTEKWGVKVPMEALLIKAVCDPIIRLPAFSAKIMGDEIHYPSQLDIGLAVDAPAGLIVVVIKDVVSKSVQQLATEFTALVEKAQARRLLPAEISGQGFTVSNIGAANGGFGTPLVPLNTAAILGVGRAREEAVVRNGAVVAGLRIPLSLSYDHRIIDGAKGRAFVTDLVGNLENPGRMLS